MNEGKNFYEVALNWIAFLVIIFLSFYVDNLNIKWFMLFILVIGLDIRSQSTLRSIKKQIYKNNEEKGNK